ncbi:MAG TPA: OmpA family protein [Bryobacteraceae bacterium]|nr:OmpA family protein [Bryobacteraceae bacterium]
MMLQKLALLGIVPALIWAQERSPMQGMAQPSSQSNTQNNPIFRVEVVSRSIAAVTYRDRSGWTKVNFEGTSLASKAKGSANVRSQLGYMQVKVEVKGLPAARTFGPLYLTYVLWAITPDGRPYNLGEVEVDSNGNWSGQVTTQLQAFGLIITAEPYFNVHQPSDVVVMQNVIRDDTRGKWQTVDAKFELLPRGQYTYHVPESQLKPVDLNSSKKSPLQLYEAQNAVQIAQYAKADQFATDTYQQAEKLWQQAQEYRDRKQWRPTIMTSREAVQKAEDARTISLRKQQQLALDNERKEAAARQLAEQQKAAASAQRAEEARQQAQLEAQQRAAADLARQQADLARQQSAADAAKSQQAAAEADRLRQQAEAEKEQLREQLLQQFNAVLPTTETPRGLVVNMQDVLFDTGKYTLKVPAQLALARISGIVLSHPGLNLQVEGYTDSTGTMELNQKLSEQRANAVRDFLMQQGINTNAMTAMGYGENYPVASNDSAAGRKLNRRVELVISGEVIGKKIGVPPSQAGPQGVPPAMPPSSAPPQSPQ